MSRDKLMNFPYRVTFCFHQIPSIRVIDWILTVNNIFSTTRYVLCNYCLAVRKATCLRMLLLRQLIPPRVSQSFVRWPFLTSPLSFLLPSYWWGGVEVFNLVTVSHAYKKKVCFPKNGTNRLLSHFLSQTFSSVADFQVDTSQLLPKTN